MTFWFPAPVLGSDETLVFCAPANFFQGRRSVGGEITVTEKRFLFVPNRLDGMLGGSVVEIARSSITSVLELAPGLAAMRERGLGAGVRPQLEVRSGTDSIVVTINRLAELAALLTNRDSS